MFRSGRTPFVSAPFGAALSSAASRRYHLIMGRWDDLPPTGLQRWWYRHRKAVRVCAVLGLLFVVGLAIVRARAGDGVTAVLLALLPGAGFISALWTTREIVRLFDSPGAPQKRSG